MKRSRNLNPEAENRSLTARFGGCYSSLSCLVMEKLGTLNPKPPIRTEEPSVDKAQAGFPPRAARRNGALIFCAFLQIPSQWCIYSYRCSVP